MLYLLLQHGYRASELCRTKRDDFDGRRARLRVRRLKGTLSTDQPITGNALRALKTYLHSRTDRLPWLFVSERGAPFTRHGLYYLVTVIGQRAGLKHVHPHMLQHSCGYALADKGADARLIQDYLGHRDLRHTARYTRTSVKRFEGLWE
jgi:type 1 fimbriae regulatory protein FimB